MMILFFWALAPCIFVGRRQCFGEHTVSIFTPEDGDKMFPSSTLKMETVCISEMLTSTNESTQRQNPEEQHHHPHRRGNLKPHNLQNALYKPLFPFHHSLTRDTKSDTSRPVRVSQAAVNTSVSSDKAHRHFALYCFSFFIGALRAQQPCHSLPYLSQC
jgi:hypothetical protein